MALDHVIVGVPARILRLRLVVSGVTIWEVMKKSKTVMKMIVLVSKIFCVCLCVSFETCVFYSSYVHFCIVDGGWSNWGKWSVCSATCGRGEITRSRQCDNPEAQFNGKKCSGRDLETVSCNHHHCPGIICYLFTYHNHKLKMNSCVTFCLSLLIRSF